MDFLAHPPKSPENTVEISKKYTHNLFGRCALFHFVPEVIGHDVSSGWTVEGQIEQTYCPHLTTFTATHPQYGIVEGDVDEVVKASSPIAFAHFFHHFPVSLADGNDIEYRR